MRRIEVWSEGYVITGGRGHAMLHGTIEAECLKDACDKLFGTDEYYNQEQLTYWGCALFDNERDAREAFG